MRTTAVLILLSVVGVAGTSLQNVRFKQFGTHIPARPDLEVRWNVPPANTLPPQVWVYRRLPRKFSPEVISYLMKLCSFTQKDRAESVANGMLFKTPDNSRHLWISPDWVSVEYDAQMTYNSTNLTKDVPDEERAIKRAKQIMAKLAIRLSDIERKDNSNEPHFSSSESKITYFVKPEPITNTLYRSIGFRRAVDGITFISVGTGGDGVFHLGDDGRIMEIHLSWCNLARVRAYRTLSVGEVIH